MTYLYNGIVRRRLRQDTQTNWEWRKKTTGWHQLPNNSFSKP